METQKFVEQPEVVDVVQFLGGPDSALPIVAWAQETSNDVVWFDEWPGTWIDDQLVDHRDEAIRIVRNDVVSYAVVGNYITRNFDGDYRVFTEEEFLRKYAPLAVAPDPEGSPEPTDA